MERIGLPSQSQRIGRVRWCGGALSASGRKTGPGVKPAAWRNSNDPTAPRPCDAAFPRFCSIQNPTIHLANTIRRS